MSGTHQQQSHPDWRVRLPGEPIDDYCPRCGYLTSEDEADPELAELVAFSEAVRQEERECQSRKWFTTNTS